jgi:cysteine desulfurase
MGEAAQIAFEMREVEVERLALLRDYFIDEVLKKVSGAELNGCMNERLPNNVNISIPGVEQDMTVIELDARGIACSSKSACKSADSGHSYVLRAIGKTSESSGAVRFTLGRSTCKEDIDATVGALLSFLDKMKVLNK